MTISSDKDKIDLSDPSVVSTKYWHVCDEKAPSKVQGGLCYVRGRVNNAIVFTSYGRSSGFAVDPIEKKPLNHFYPGSSVLSIDTANECRKLGIKNCDERWDEICLHW